MESTQKIINEDCDSLEMGTPGKLGCLKIYGNFNNPEAMKIKIDNAKMVRDYAQANIAINV